MPDPTIVAELLGALVAGAALGHVGKRMRRRPNRPEQDGALDVKQPPRVMDGALDVAEPEPKPRPAKKDHHCHYQHTARETLNGVPRSYRKCSQCGDSYWADD